MRIGVFDIEANGLLDEATTIHCAVFKDINTKEVIKLYGDSLKNLSSVMESFDTLIAHNGIQYDFPLIEKLTGYRYKGVKFDTLLVSRLHDPKRRIPFNFPKGVKSGNHSLEVWGYRVGRGKPEHSDWETFSEDMLHRCTEDVEITELVYYELLRESEGYNWEPAYKLTFKLFEILLLQEQYGWLVDKEYINSKINMLEHWIRRIDKVLNKYLPIVVEIQENKVNGEYNYVKKPFLKSGEYSTVSKRFLDEWVHSIQSSEFIRQNVYSKLPSGFPRSGRVISGCFSRVDFRIVNLDSNMETKDFMLSSGWIPKEWNTNTKGERTSPKLNKDDPFEGIEGGVGRLVAKRVQCRQRKSILEGWLSIIREDGRISSRIANLAVTGRATHRGIVNVPNVDAFFGKQMRKCFISEEGKVLVGCDAASCQDRMLANRAGNPQFTDMLLNGDKSKGTDGHSLATKAVNNAASRLGLDAISRSKGKNFNFGWKFGASDAKLGLMLKAGKEAGSLVREELEKVFPAQAELIKRLEDEWYRTAKKRRKTIEKNGNYFQVTEYYDGIIKGLDGRPIKISSPHAILVYILQSDEAITMAAAYCLMYKRLIRKYQWGVDFGIVCWYHDEVTVECREEIAEDVAKIMEDCIRDAGNFFKLNVPQEGEAEIGKDWYEIH